VLAPRSTPKAGTVGTHFKRAHGGVEKLLIDAGVDVNMQGRKHGSALQAALEMGHNQIIEFLIDEGADIITDDNMDDDTDDGLEHGTDHGTEDGTDGGTDDGTEDGTDEVAVNQVLTNYELFQLDVADAQYLERWNGA
jgi:hypothetical protein